MQLVLLVAVSLTTALATGTGRSNTAITSAGSLMRQHRDAPLSNVQDSRSGVKGSDTTSSSEEVHSGWPSGIDTSQTLEFRYHDANGQATGECLAAEHIAQGSTGLHLRACCDQSSCLGDNAATIWQLTTATSHKGSGSWHSVQSLWDSMCLSLLATPVATADGTTSNSYGLTRVACDSQDDLSLRQWDLPRVSQTTYSGSTTINQPLGYLLRAHDDNQSHCLQKDFTDTGAQPAGMLGSCSQAAGNQPAQWTVYQQTSDGNWDQVQDQSR